MMFNTQDTSMLRTGTLVLYWGELVAGIVLFVSPWYTVTWSNPASSWNAWIVGALIAIVALWALSNRRSANAQVPEIINAILGAWTFISPWVLGYTYLPGMAWSAWILGAITAILALSALAQLRSSRPVATG
jgi:uncharacterized integral membrane protein